MKILKLALFLAVVAGLSGAALSSVYEMTDPVIQEAKIASEKENLVKIILLVKNSKLLKQIFQIILLYKLFMKQVAVVVLKVMFINVVLLVMVEQVHQSFILLL